jgi:hypothetical protein
MEIPKHKMWLKMAGRQFTKGDASTPIPLSSTLDSRAELSMYSCASSCLSDDQCTQFVYNKTSHECSRYKNVSGHQAVSPVGDNEELVVYTDQAEVNYVCFISHTNLTFQYRVTCYWYVRRRCFQKRVIM